MQLSSITEILVIRFLAMNEKILEQDIHSFNENNQGWIEQVAAETHLLDSDYDIHRYSLMLPVSRIVHILNGIINPEIDDRIKLKFKNICLHRINRQLAGQAWRLLQNNLDNKILLSLCLRSRLAWEGRDYSQINRPDNIVGRWLERLASSSPEDEIPDWVKMLDSVLMKSNAATDSISLKDNIYTYSYDQILSRYGNSDFSLRQYLIDFHLIEKSEYIYTLLKMICSEATNRELIVDIADLIEINTLPWSEQSGQLIESYLLALNPVQLSHSLCGNIFSSVDQEQLQQDIGDEALDKLFRWQRISLVEKELAENEYKIDCLSKYYDMVKNVQVKEIRNANEKIIGRNLLIFFDNIVVYDSSNRPDEFLIFPMKLFTSNEQDIDIFEEIEARQAILREESEHNYSDSLISSVKDGNGSQALCLKIIRGASLLYAKEVISILLD